MHDYFSQVNHAHFYIKIYLRYIFFEGQNGTVYRTARINKSVCVMLGSGLFFFVVLYCNMELDSRMCCISFLLLL